jgi:hypothetical protein
MSLVSVAMELAQKHAFDGDMDFGEEFDGHVRFGHDTDFEVEDIRRMWAELRDAGDADYVQVQDGDENVNIYRRGDVVYIEEMRTVTTRSACRVRSPSSMCCWTVKATRSTSSARSKKWPPVTMVRSSRSTMARPPCASGSTTTPRAKSCSSSSLR